MDRFEFGKYITELREKANMNKKELARLVGCSGPTITRLERGEFKKPSPQLFVRMAPVLGTTKNDLMQNFGYLDEDDFGANGDILTTREKIIASISDDDELLEFFNELDQRDDLRIVIRQVRKLTPKTMKQVINIIKAIEDGEEEEVNGLDRKKKK